MLIHSFAHAYYALEIAEHSEVRYFRFISILCMYSLLQLFPILDIATLAAMSGFLGYYSDNSDKRLLSYAIDIVCNVLKMIQYGSAQPVAWTYMISMGITLLSLALFE